MLSFGTRSAGNLYMHLFKSVRDFGVVTGQAIVKSDCEVRPIFCVLGHFLLPLSFEVGPQWNHAADKASKQRAIEFERP